MPEETTPPAALLRVTPPALARAARSLCPPPARRARVRRGRAPFEAGQPGRQRGYVRLWRARSIDLRAWPAPEAGDTVLPSRLAGAGSQEWTAQRDNLRARLAALLAPPLEVMLRSAGPLQWPAEFFAYQIDGIYALLSRPQMLLGDDMGLGKSIQAIAALRLLLHRREIERALVVVPASLVGQWQRELARWAPELVVMAVTGTPAERYWQWRYPAHVALVSYETLRADEWPRREMWDVVVLDEAQRIKNQESDVARACKKLPRCRAWALTGTPLENRAEDVRSILEFVSDGTLGVGLAPGPELRGALAQLQLRRRKADVLPDLPPKLIIELPLELTPAQRRAYDAAAKDGLMALRSGGAARLENVLALITRLKQLCNFAPDGSSAKLLDLEARLESLAAAGHKALIFTQFTSDDSGARRLARALARFAPLLYTGDLAQAEREQVLERFRRDARHPALHPALIVSLRAGGQGLNLQEASYVFHFDRWWNPAVEQQAEARAHRLGQTRPVHVYRYLVQDTVEERIDAVLQSKVALFAQLVEGASLDLSRLLTKEELWSVVGLGQRPTP